MKLSICAFASATALICISYPAKAALFNCGKASSYSEHMVCAVPQLSSLDEVLAHNYGVMKAANIGEGARTDLKVTQRAWLVERDQCDNVDCLIDIYRQRVDEICYYPVLSGVFPDCRSPTTQVPGASNKMLYARVQHSDETPTRYLVTGSDDGYRLVAEEKTVPYLIDMSASCSASNEAARVGVWTRAGDGINAAIEWEHGDMSFIQFEGETVPYHSC
jgi:uncharacterized protein YecT (DUF1311 family)